MAVKGRDKAHRLVSNAREGIIKYGHLGLNKVIERKLRDARAQLDGREDFLKCHEIRQALSANIETFAAAARDPSVEDQAAMVEGVNELLQKCVPLYHALISNQSLAKACDAIKAAEAALGAIAGHCLKTLTISPALGSPAGYRPLITRRMSTSFFDRSKTLARPLKVVLPVALM